MDCFECDEGWEHCHEVSIEHADGSTECLGYETCDLPHDLHGWQLACSALVPPCPCAPKEEPAPLVVAALLAA